jgi:hypothetical protein
VHGIEGLRKIDWEGSCGHQSSAVGTMNC